MTFLVLLLEFLKIGAFAFGGAYGAIPLIRESVLSNGWMDEAQLMNLLGISESTPGPIMVNAATMTGFGQAGIIGAAVATLGVILPSFLIMLVIPRLQKKWSGHRVIRLAMRGIKPCLAGVICATGIHLAIELLSVQNADVGFDALALVLLCILGLFSFGWKKYRRKPVSPIVLIVVAAVLGVCVF